MKILFFDKKAGVVKLLVETLEDLWHLENILEMGDKISSSSTRIVKFGDKEERKKVNVTLVLEDLKFSKSLNRLRLRGKIIFGTPEDFVQLGKYHTIEMDDRGKSKLKIEKKWKPYQIKRLRESEKESKRELIKIIVMDEKKAMTAILRGYGLEYGPEFYNNGSKKGDNYEKYTEKYFSGILKYVEQTNTTGGTENKILIAGPGFTKDNFKEYIKKNNPKIYPKLFFDSCSYAERNGISELLKRGIVKKIIGEQRLEKEEKLMEEFMKYLNQEKSVAYGIDEVSFALGLKAIKKLLVLDELLRKNKKVQKIMENAEKLGAETVVFSIEGEAGIKLKGFGGIASILRFEIK